MRKKRLSNSRREVSRAGEPSAVSRFLGVSLSGGKNARTVVVALDFYQLQNKLIVSKIIDDLGTDETATSDQSLLNVLNTIGSKSDYIAFDVPLSLPTCVTCQLKCPGFENCKEPHISWFWEFYKKLKKKKKTLKLFTPYTQRPIEAYITHLLEEPFHPSDALGANVAPITARMNYLQKFLDKNKVIEVFPRLSLWRIGRSLKVSKRHLRFHKHSVEGDKSRLVFLNTLSDSGSLFIYQQDLAKMVQSGHTFDAFVCALTAYLKYTAKTEDPPLDFPQSESWLAIPTESCW